MAILIDSLGRPLTVGSLPIAVTDALGSGIPLSGLVARWEADEGVTLSGSDATGWTDSVGGIALSLLNANAPGNILTAPGGAAALGLTNGSGMRATGTGSLPSGSAARSAVLCFRPRLDTFFGGFGWGSSSATGTSFVLGCDDQGALMLDWFGGRVLGAAAANNAWVVLIGTYDGTTVRLYENGVEVAAQAVALTTGTAMVNVGLSFSGYDTEGDYGLCAAWSRVLSAAEIAQVVAYARARWITDVTAPVLTGAAITATTSVSATWTVTTNEGNGTLYTVLSTSALPLTVTAIRAQGAATPIFASGAYAGTAASLTPGSTYYLQAMHEDAAGNPSAVTVSAGAATASVDVTAPTLTGATGAADGAVNYTASVTTNEGNGTLFHVVTTSATLPTAAQVAAGQDHTGAAAAAAGSQPVASTGSLAVAGGGLTAGTTWWVHFMHEDAAGNQSAVVASASFATDAVSGELPVGYAEIATWGADAFDPLWTFVANILPSLYPGAGLTPNKTCTAATIASVLAGAQAGDVIRVDTGASIGTALNALFNRAFASEVIVYAQTYRGVTATSVNLGASAQNVTLLGFDFATGPLGLVYANGGVNLEISWCRGGSFNFANVNGLTLHYDWADMNYPQAAAGWSAYQRNYNCFQIFDCINPSLQNSLATRPNGDTLQVVGCTSPVIRDVALLGAGPTWAEDAASGGGISNPAGGYHPDAGQSHTRGSSNLNLVNFVALPRAGADRKGGQGLHIASGTETGTILIENGVALSTLSGNSRATEVFGSGNVTFRNVSCMASAATAANIRFSVDKAENVAENCITSAVLVNNVAPASVTRSGNIEYGSGTAGTAPSVFAASLSGTWHRVADWQVRAPFETSKGAASLLATIATRATAAGL